MSISPAIRKAAILVSCLERKEADALLESMPEAMSRQVRQAMLSLEEIDSDERDEVIQEFVHRGVKAPAPRASEPGVELAGALSDQIELPQAARSVARETARDDRPPFEFLRDADADRLARFLCDERPQTVALVLSYLPADQSARIAASLPKELQSDVLRKLSDLDEADPEILREVEHALRERIERDNQNRARRTAGLEIVAKILDAAGPKLANTWRAALDEAPEVVATVETPRTNEKQRAALTWAEFERLEPEQAAAAVLATPPETSVLALAGATPGFFARLISAMHPADAEFYRRATSQLSPTRLSDIDAAQRLLAASAEPSQTTPSQPALARAA